MRSANDLSERLIWATRGRAWGFRFLLNGGLPDPLGLFERSFAGLGDTPTICHRTADKVALRFPDPLGRRDASGRLIPHEFVVFGDLAEAIESVEDGLRYVWPLVAEAYAAVWNVGRAPVIADLRFAATGDPSPNVPRSARSDGGEVNKQPD